MLRRLVPIGLVFLLLSCGTPPVAEQPTAVPPTPIVVVVTATAPATTATKAATLTPTKRPTITPAPTRTPVPTPITGKWKTDIDKSTFDDSKTVILSLDSEGTIEGPVGATRPTLILRCKEGETEVYIVTDMQADVEGVSDKATIRLRFDQEKASTVEAGKSTSGDALFVPLPKPFIDVLLNYKQLVVGFTPFGASPVEMTFKLGGLAEAIKPLREACPP